MTDTPTPTPLPRATGLNGAVRYAEDEVRAWLEKRKRADHSKAA